MKKITIVLLLIASLPVFSQSLVQDGKIWSSRLRGTEGPSYHTEQTMLKGDTLIEGLSYLKVYKSTTNPPQWSLANKVIREEDNVIYTKSTWEGNTEPERVLYNFNLKQGDSFYRDELDDEPIIVESVETKDYQGRKLKTLNLSYYNTTITWIEELGTLGKVLEPYHALAVGEDANLLCVSVNDESLYTNPEFNSCFVEGFITNIDELSSQNKLIKVFASEEGIIHMQLLEDTSGEIRFYDNAGKMLRKEAIKDSNLEICTPQNGILLYQFENTKGEVANGKVFAY